ncbi:hypothetical protein CDLVIII_2424 [Clostridium sp. DL-VIII]|uniref:SIR2 family protein n=1 Tax=Clostridium sp. DL-VIII TaxID=641107 RepID=UPI00023AFEFA|nr:SIR2 family protein [Clostridium sp. DL-VIII]EHI99069.1 hypothetical protein CDLVIII_2424 [Clostridium sp. DL-VIII]
MKNMKILDYSNHNDKEEIIDIIKTLMNSKHLVPIIGAGFTAGSKTKCGKVPNANVLKDYMIELIAKEDNLDYEDVNQLKQMALSDISDELWNHLDGKEHKTMKNNFISYMENNFKEVYDLEQPQRKLLNSGWQYIYTLNYDDAIENCLRIVRIFPYDSHNPNVIKNKQCLFKIHGDIHRYINTGESKYCILSKRQYIQALSDPHNKDMLKNLQNDFYSKSVLFIGCGLANELDLLFTAEIGFSEKVKLDEEHKVLYLYYDSNLTSDKKFPIQDKIKLQQYGITHIIRVNNLDEINDLYYSINKIHLEQNRISRDDELNEFMNLQFNKLDDRDKDNISYLFNKEKIKIDIKTKSITLPSFFINRNITESLFEDLREKKDVNLFILYGNRISGKTFCLLNIAQRLYTKKIYYFPSELRIEDHLLLKIIQCENSIFLFDEGTITSLQMRDIIFAKLGEIKNRKSKIIVSVNKSDGDFYRYYSQNKLMLASYIGFYPVENRFVDKEIKEFNEKIAYLSLNDYKEQNSILDYIVIIENSSLKNQKSLLPGINFLNYDNVTEIKAMIVLATQMVVSSQTAIDLGIDKVLYELCEKANITIQRDYLSDIEQSISTHSGFKFVVNSAYWVFRCLSKLAEDTKNHSSIASAYYDIINDYKNLYKTEAGISNEFYRITKQYYFLDTVQLMFSNRKYKGSLVLPNRIYEELHPLLSDNYQFLHQEAKCKLRVARREKRQEIKVDFLERAYLNINRAYSLASEHNAHNIEYTLVHMLVTKALILTNYILVYKDDRKKIHNAIKVYYDVFAVNKYLLNDLEKDDMEDVHNFINYVSTEMDRNLLHSNDIEYLEEIIKEITGKTAKFS